MPTYHIYAHTQKSNLEGNYLSIKLGQTVSKTAEGRVSEQEKAEANKHKFYNLLTYEIDYQRHINVDDRIRNRMIDDAVLLDNKNLAFKQGELEYDGKDRNEFIDVEVSKYIKRHKNKFKSIINDEEFISYIDQKCQEAINKEFKNKKFRRNMPVLRDHQVISVDKMTENMSSTWFLLQYCARYGKTYSTLEYVQRVSKKHDNLVLLIISKNLASNNSFVISAEGINYNFDIETISLFRSEDNVRESLSSLNYLKGKNVVIVTDEVDQASHTSQSREKINKVLKLLKGNLINFILMSGTGIDKGMKIVKSSPYSDSKKYPVFKDMVTYTDLLTFYKGNKHSPIVNRRFHYMKYELGSHLLNISQSIQDLEKHDEVISFLDSGPLKFNKKYHGRHPFEPTRAIQVFISNISNEDLISFSESYQEAHPEINVISMCSNTGWTNGNAENNINRMLRQDARNMVIFCCEMGQRSFSIPEINRVLVLKDGELSDASIQKMSRALTWEKKKDVADMFVISGCEFNEFACSVFQKEEGSTLEGKELRDKFYVFFDNNTFVEHFDGKSRIIKSDDSKLKILDLYTKYKTKINYFIHKFYLDDNLVLDGVSFNPTTAKTKTCVVKEEQTKSLDSSEESSVDELDTIMDDIGASKKDKNYLKKLEMLFNVSLLLPTVSTELCSSNGLDGITTDKWDMYLGKIVPKSIFDLNMKYEKFRNEIDDIFVRFQDLSDDEKTNQLITLSELRQTS